jgi:hypothetical protein
MRMYVRQSMIRKNVINVYITAGVMKICRSTKKPEKNAKKAMSEARSQAYSELYRKLDTKGENDIYRMAKV